METFGERGIPRKLRSRSQRPASTRREPRRPNPQGRETGYPAHRTSDEVRACHQPQDGQGARADDSAIASAACGRVDPMISRRQFLARGLGLAIAPIVAEAQQPGGISRIGYLTASRLSSITARTEAFRQGLRNLGYVEGQNIVIEWRSADETLNRLPALAAELVDLKVAVIVAGDNASTAAAKEVTKTVPIVMATSGDPVGIGLVASLARPGGNVTGLTSLSID